MTDLLDQGQFGKGRSTDPVVQADRAVTQEAQPTSAIPIKFIAAALILLVASSVLPAWRVQLFGDRLEWYYAVRATGVVAFVIFFSLFCRGFHASLKVAAAASARTGYGDSLLSLRAMACLIVLIGHGTTVVFPPDDLAFVASHSRFFWLSMPMPWAGVWVFFTLSGYLMGKGFFTGRYSFDRAGILRFYKNRIFRIVPLFYFAILLVAIFVRPEELNGSNITNILSLLFFDTDGTRPPHFIGLLWSIATEMQFYVTAPFFAGLIFLVARRNGALPVVVTAVLLGLVYRTTGAHASNDDGATWVRSIYSPLFGNLDIFVTGMAAAWFVRARPLSWPRLSHGILLAGVVYVAAAICWSRLLGSGEATNLIYGLRYYSPTIFALATAALIVILENAARQPAGVPSRLLVAGTQKLGILTYAIYLWHEPIFLAYAKSIAHPVSARNTLSALVVAGIAVFAFSWITWKAIEKPFDDLRNTT
jgi:peptidoglycan/LPS O-acetylase OafA/YrhL